jgi:phosphoribosylamine--glycine ligase
MAPLALTERRPGACREGGGGRLGRREHALAEVLGRTAEVVVTPGNPASPVRWPRRSDLVADGSVDLVVIGPEQPLVDGLADRSAPSGVRVFGPGADGARWRAPRPT